MDDIDQTGFISPYQLEQFGVGHVGEIRRKDLTRSHTPRNHNQSFSPIDVPDASTPLHFNYAHSARDLSLPLLQKHSNTQQMYESPDDEEVSLRKYLGVSVGLVSLITENLLSHPFVVLRRQCQVHHSSTRRHLVPFTLVPAIIHLHQRQSITTLWKGLGSCLLVRGMTLAVEDFISKITPWPK